MHHWQDIVLGVGALVLSAALVPSIRGKDKPHVSTSLLTASVLFVFAVVYATLSLWYTMASTALNGLFWLILAIQKARRSKLAPTIKKNQDAIS